MPFALSTLKRSGFAAAGVIAAGLMSGPAAAEVVTGSPSLPLIGVSYVSPNGGAGCFTVANVCVTPGALTMTSTVSSNFLPAVQDIVANVTYDGAVTGAINEGVVLTGTVEEQVIGRMSNTELGSFQVDVTNLDLSGTVAGHTLQLMLTTGATSTGTTSIVADGNQFRIDSFFDVFVDLSLVGTGLSTTGREIQLVAVPETSTWAMMLAGFAGLGLAVTRRAGRSAAAG
jgi:hypothetical protein